MNGQPVRLTLPQRLCLLDLYHCRTLHRVRCGWQSCGGRPPAGHRPATLDALVRHGLARTEHVGTVARLTPAGRRRAKVEADVVKGGR